MRRLVVIPALNEERSLPSLLDALRVEASDWDVCVIDDGSIDRTALVARSAGVQVLRCSFNLGIGGAVQLGYLWARERGYRLVAQIDGDGQHDPRYLARAAAPVLAGQADMVVGSRFLEEGGFKSSALRRAGIQYLSRLIKLQCGVTASDPTSGFRIAGPRAIELFANSYPSDYPEPEAIALLVRSGLRFAEVPVVMRAREHGRSSINTLKTIYYLIKVTLALLLVAPVSAGATGEAP